MASRDSKTEIKRDIAFLEEMKMRFDKSREDIIEREYVEQMIKDWLTELKKLQAGEKTIAQRVIGKKL